MSNEGRSKPAPRRNGYRSVPCENASLTKGGENAVFTGIDSAYLRWELGVAVRDRCNIFPQRFPPPCAGGKSLCRIHAHHGRRRGVPCNYKASTKQHRRRDSNLLSDRNGMADRQAQRRGNEPFRLGLVPDSFGARYPHLDEWY